MKPYGETLLTFLRPYVSGATTSRIGSTLDTPVEGEGQAPLATAP